MKVINGIKVYSVKEIAELMGIAYQTALKYVKQGRIPAARTGNTYAITEHSLMKWLNGETPQANAFLYSKKKDNSNSK